MDKRHILDKKFIFEYMPDYYQGVYEMEKILAAQGVSLSDFDFERNRTLLNQFVIKTDLQGVSVFEDQVGIVPDPEDSLEIRQNNVLMHLLPPKPLTVRYLNYLMNFMNLKAEAKIDHGKRYVQVDAKSEDINLSNVRQLQYLLNICIPANMIYEIMIALSKAEIENTLNYGIFHTVDSDATSMANTDQLNFDIVTREEIYKGVGFYHITDAKILADKDQFLK
ncbi:hypothetical protein GCM10022297_01020 [Lactobacillus hamsteri]|uniref:Phage related protein n=1 Tax=Lactobacillus hamsteri DSM 5661 = JCM 6256 TaxID=1423754 RepID=A0A0R1Y3V5_9LACO|nr:putative phage tail protein [Lactobacillus hamsteri]KRM36992.1 Phage related protein [Lactobacillus hamsteri DSM 5661 = JCM 6256]